MKLFDISDVLSATTGRLVSTRHMEGIYDVYNFLTGDSLYTNQLPRAAEECDPWLKSQYPQLMKDAPEMVELLARLDHLLSLGEPELACGQWVSDVRERLSLPQMLPLHAMGEDMHTRIDPIEELRAMVGDDKVIAVKP